MHHVNKHNPSDAGRLIFYTDLFFERHTNVKNFYFFVLKFLLFIIIFIDCATDY